MDSLLVACPKCQAAPGKKCRTVTTNRSTDTHVARRGVGVFIPCRWEDERPVEFLFFGRTHIENEICAQGCVVHNQTDHRMRYWRLIWRADRGIFERLCPCHGCGHPDPDQGPYWKATDQDWQWVHGCTGCCSDGAGEMRMDSDA